MQYRKFFFKAALKAAKVLGTPEAFAATIVIVFVWAASGPVFHFSDTWQLVINTGTTIITFLMVFLLQASQNHSDSVTQTKLDEILRSIDNANNRLIALEEKADPEEIEAERQLIKDTADADGPGQGS